MKVSAKSSGVAIEVDGTEIGLDTRKRCDINFISHAHSDHVGRRVERVACSDATASLVSARYNMELERVMPDNFELIPSGHILGSSSLLLDSGEGRVLFTGDFCTRDRLFLEGFRPPKAEVLILETTFGNPRYAFPDANETIKQSVGWIEEQLESGRSVNALGYSLGKAQVLCKMLEHLMFPVYIHGSILKMNSVYSQHGVELHGFIPYREAKKRGYLDNGPHVVVSPRRPENMSLNAKFTGWAVDGNLGADIAFPLSDHSGFDELLDTVRKVDPSIVFTLHGFKEHFADVLRKEGYKAIPLTSHQMRIADFL